LHSLSFVTGLAANGFINAEQLEIPAGPDVLHCFYSRCWYVHANAKYGMCQVLICIKVWPPICEYCVVFIVHRGVSAVKN
jgi:hypothetical protein